MKTAPSSLITDEQSLISAKSRFGHPIPVYDDGFGSLFIHRDSMGISGIVRASSWEDAYEICEDEFFPEAGKTVEELRAEYNFKQESVKFIHDAVKGWRCVVASDYPIKEHAQIKFETIKTPCTDENGWTENALFQESYGFRPNGARTGKRENGEPRDPIGHGIYEKDLNGDYLDSLTPKLLAELEITLEIVPNE